MNAEVLQRPATFDRVDRIKEAVGRGNEILPGDDRLWILGGPLVVSIDGTVYAVPRGFTTDGASVPWLAQVITGWQPWDVPQRWGAIVHDWLYCCNGKEGHSQVAKSFADLAFRAVLKNVGAGLLRREAMYRAVDLFGGHAYDIDQETGPSIWV